MDARPHEIRDQIARTRASLDLHLDRLEAQMDVTKWRMIAAAQLCGTVGAVAAAAVALVVFWRRQRRTPARRLALAPPAL